MNKIHNFSAGPSILPQSVIQKAAGAVEELDGIGLSLIEISHRSKEFVAIMERARGLVRELLGVPDGYSVLFLQGGASLGFYIAAINLMKENGKAAYVNTGTWAKKAIAEAKLLGSIDVVASSEDSNFNYIPKGFEIPSDAEFFHYTSNNTICGTQFHQVPEPHIPVVCDMSSDIFSKPIDVSKFDMIYAGAQKNMGPAGTTLYIVKNSALGHTGRNLPSMLDLQKHISKDSMYNTPPVFAVYASMLTLEWLKELGGVEAMARINNEKARTLYNAVDELDAFEGTAAIEDRSKMNATFVLKEGQDKERFDKMWNEAGISGIKGHRSVGGYRASMYNALPLESVQALTDVMRKFAQ